MADITIDFEQATVEIDNPTTTLEIETGIPSASSVVRKTDTDVSTYSWVLDEDDFASDSATKVPTQQSTKALVDTLTTAAALLAKILTVDGAGSGLDADTLDGAQGAAYALLSTLASTANGNGASRIGIEDSGGLLAATTVEGALAEIQAAVDVLEAAGYVVGPASATDTAIALFDTTTGKKVKNSTVTIGPTGGMSGIGNAISTGNAVSTNDVAMEFGGLRTGDGNAYFDIHATSGSDFEMRWLRVGGANGDAVLGNTGTGDFDFIQYGAGAFDFKTANVSRLGIGAGGGIVVRTAGADPTGGNKGDGTINASAVYDDNTLLTDIVAELAQTGTVDTAKWDAMVPDVVVPEHDETVPVMEDETYDEDYEEIDDDGDIVMRKRTVTRPRRAKALIPVFDDEGNGIGAKEIELTETIRVPEKRVARKHYAAHLLKQMADDGFDPSDPVAYCTKVKERGALPGMPNLEEWEHGKFSLGELHTRNTLATELLQLAFDGLVKEVQALRVEIGRKVGGK